MFGQKKNFGQKKFLGRKNVGFAIISGPKICGSKKRFVSNEIFGLKNCGCPKQILGSKKIVGHKRNLDLKQIWV